MLPHAYYVKILHHFRMDHSKAWAWLNQWQPSLGAIPYNMIRKGKEKKLMSFIDDHMLGLSYEN